MVGCGGGGSSSTPQPPAISVSVAPATSTLDQGAQATFTATVSNTSNTAVTWSVVENGGGSINAGTGVYTAPAAAGTFTIKATSAADSTKSATASVTVRAVNISMNPTTATVAATASRNFTATVTGTVDTAVTYSVQEETGGSVDGTGSYTAPAQWGTYHVIAKAHADATKTASATITVPGPAPIISSTAPSAAVEGTAYTYAIDATDPAGTALTYSIIAAPAGATIAANTVTWTPTSAQSRIENSFTIQVESAAKGSNTQTWKVTPNGTITVKNGNYYVSEDGTKTFVAAPQPPGPVVPFVLVSDGAGGTTKITGSFVSGQAVISNVPAGSYLVNVGTTTYNERSENNPDISTTTFGRADAVKGSDGTTIKFQFSGLDPFGANDQIYYVTPNNAGNVVVPWYTPVVGSTTADITADMYAAPLPDASKADTGYAYQLSSATYSGTAVNVLKKTSALLSLTVANGSSPTVPVQMSAPSKTGSIRLNVAASEFIDIMKASAPGVSDVGASFTLSSNAPSGFAAPLLFVGSAPQTNFDLGDINYGNPWPSSWKTSIEYGGVTMIQPYQLPGTSSPLTVSLFSYWSTTTVPTASAPFKPTLGLYSALRINGGAFSTAQTGVGLTPVISWDAPTVGTPDVYSIGLYRLYNGGSTKSTLVRFFNVKGNSIQIPPDLLVNGNSYYLRISEFSHIYSEDESMIMSLTPMFTP